MTSSRKRYTHALPRRSLLPGNLVPQALRSEVRRAAGGAAERQRLQRMLLVTQARYRSLYRNMLEGVAYCRVLDRAPGARDVLILDVNPAFEILTGLKNVVGKKVSEVVPGIWESNPELFDFCARAAAGGKPERLQTEVAALERWFSVSAYGWQPNSFVAIFDNITERKHIEEETEDLYQNAPCGYHSVDADSVIVRINDTELRWLGYAREEVVGKRKMPDLLSEASRPQFLEDFARLVESGPKFMEKGASTDLELEMIRKDGSLLPARFNATVVRNAQGRFVRTRTTVNDISATRLRERERAEHARRMEQLSRRLVTAQEDERRMLASEMHDRTSPNLAAIAINLEMILLGLPETLKQRIGPRLEDSGALLKDTMQTVREINTSLRPALLDYAGLRPALHGFVQQFAARTGMAVRIEGTESQERLPAETESELFRIAREALTNCAKYSAAKNVRIELENDARHARLCICDDGVGFDLGMLGRSGHPAGLGILTMRERAEFAGGRFCIDSRPGRGTRISVEI